MCVLNKKDLLQCSCSRSWEKMSINSMFGEHLNGFENSSAIVGADDDEEVMDVDDESDVYDSEEDNVATLLQYANTQPLAYQEMPASVCASTCKKAVIQLLSYEFNDLAKLIFKVLDAACNDSQGLLNFIFDSQLSRAISIIFLPWTLPVEFCLNFTKK